MIITKYSRLELCYLSNTNFYYRLTNPISAINSLFIYKDLTYQNYQEC